MNTKLQTYGGIAGLAILVVFILQVLILVHLYQPAKQNYTMRIDEALERSIYDLNMATQRDSTASVNMVSFDYGTNTLIILKKGNRYKVHMDKNVNDRFFCEAARYDIRNHSCWSLQALDTIFRKILKQEKLHTSIVYTLTDSLGHELATFRSGNFVRWFCIATEPIQLGFLDKHMLTAYYNFPILYFFAENWVRILAILGLLLILGCCVSLLYQSVRREKKSGEYREQFVHALVHDLKTPLQVVKKDMFLFGRFLPDSGPKSLEHQNAMRKDVERLSEKIDLLLKTFTDVNGLKLSVREFSLQNLLENLLAHHRYVCPENKTAVFYCEYADDVDMIQGDYDHLYNSFDNLIGNALKYSDKEVEVAIGCCRADRGVEIRVADNGWGIDPNDRKHLFDRNFRGRVPVGKQVEGYGFGLHYVQMVVHAHKGKISVEDREQGGSVFVILLP